MDLETIGLMLVAYLIGSVPFSWLVARTQGIDLRKVGSGNTGASNVWRTVGFKYFLVASMLDVLKGWLPTFVAHSVLGLTPLQTVLIGLCAILGHVYSVFMRFRGGKAVATSGGVVLGFAPWLTLIAMLIWVTVYKLSGFPSVASLVDGAIIAVAGTALAYFGVLDPVYAAFLWLVVVGIYYLHRANIQRLMRGQEIGIGSKH